jgi:phytanoyl-CoA hydroxylase
VVATVPEYQAIDYAGKFNDDDLGFYREQGFIGVNGVLTPQEIGELSDVTDEFIERSRQVSESGDVFDLEPGHTAEQPRLRRLKSPQHQHEVYRNVLRNEKILDLVAQLIGDAMYYKSGKLNIKGSEFGSPVEWHQDWGFFPHTNDDQVTIGIPLDDMAIENGCLSVVPGSHLGPTLDHRQDGFFVGAVDPSGFEQDAVPIQLRAGGISLHHVRMLHGSAPNVSSRPRRLLLYTYVAADAWPLTENAGWEKLQGQMLRGELSLTPRMADLPVRLPYPRDLSVIGSIYEVQKEVRHRGFQKTDK